jgi:cobalt-zinc-cadmium efflux system membrane fusion protein
MIRVTWAIAIALAVLAGGWLAGRYASGPVAPNDIASHQDSGSEPHEAKAVSLTAQQRAAAGIVVEAIAPAPLAKVFRAPGEVRTNDYTTHAVTARYQASVVTRKAQLNDKVTKDQPLATLFSPEMATAQTEFLLADEEYRRIHALNRDFVPGRRYSEVDAKRRETRAKLETFGLAASQIDALAKGGRSSLPSGQFDIVAPAAGTIIADDFRMGAVVEPGKVLFVITDTGDVWIEAHVSPTVAPDITGTTAKVYSGERSIDAHVVQVQQQIDEATRTIGVRLQARDAGFLKPGLFVDVELYGKAEIVMSLPTDAIVRGPDGDWTVYIENAKGQFEPTEIELLHAVGLRTVISGLTPGAKVVTRGAFFVMAEAAKAGFDPHNH